MQKSKPKKWNDVNYNELKKDYNKVCREFRKNPYDTGIRVKLVSLRKKLHKLRKTKMKEFESEMLKKISHLEKNDPTEFWKLINKIKQNKNENALGPDLYADYFSRLYKPHSHKTEDTAILKKLQNMNKHDKFVNELDKDFCIK